MHLCLVCQQESMPFAVVGSDKEYQVNGKRVLGRKTPWGIIEGNSVHLLEELAAGQLCLSIKPRWGEARSWDVRYKMNASQPVP